MNVAIGKSTIFCMFGHFSHRHSAFRNFIFHHHTDYLVTVWHIQYLERLKYCPNHFETIFRQIGQMFCQFVALPTISVTNIVFTLCNFSQKSSPRWQHFKYCLPSGRYLVPTKSSLLGKKSGTRMKCILPEMMILSSRLKIFWPTPSQAYGRPTPYPVYGSYVCKKAASRTRQGTTIHGSPTRQGTTIHGSLTRRGTLFCWFPDASGNYNSWFPDASGNLVFLIIIGTFHWL